MNTLHPEAPVLWLKVLGWAPYLRGWEHSQKKHPQGILLLLHNGEQVHTTSFP